MGWSRNRGQLVWNGVIGAILMASTSLPVSSSPLVLAPNGGLSSSGSFLHGVSEDIISDYEDLASYSGDVDNLSEIEIVNSFDSVVIVSQKSHGPGAGNRSRVRQEGVSNTALVGQKGNNNVAYINQEGDNNAAAVGQLGFNGEALVNQQGDNNLALLGQANFSGSPNRLSINQKNDNNIALVVAGGGANLGISQDGGDAAIINASSAMRVYINQAN
ncbi:curlin subunit CsgB [Vibrio maritimus]|uniref:curlin subunit CsgB n=1 Tax=Vibrio maritimus TaxID=990268 RepID=UPI00373608EA